MNEYIKYTEKDDKLIIVIKPIRKSIIKVAFLFLALLGIGVFLTLTVVTFYNLIGMGYQVLWFWILIPLGLLSGKVLLDEVYQKEVIEVTKDRFTLIDKYLFTKQVKSFSTADKFEIDFVGTKDKALLFTIEDGVLEISNHHETKRFAKNIPSWEAEILLNKVQQFI